MSADRGTLPRGPAPAPPGSNSLPTAATSRRPPRVPRERKPALAALALLLIVGGALGAAYLVVQNNHRVTAIEITQQIGAGQQIPVSAMQAVDIAPAGGLGYVPWNQAAQVARYFAAVPIPPGTLLSSAMVAPSSSLAAGRDVVGLALKEGQLPGGLQVGDRVTVYEVSDSTQSCPGAPGTPLAVNAIVLGISTPSTATGNSATDVRVGVYPPDAGPVACNAANGNVGIAVLPPGHQRAGASPPATQPKRQRPPGRRHPPGPGASTTPTAGATPSVGATPTAGATG
jgi:hypothetical protein